MTIETHLSEADFIKVNLIILYKKIFVKILAVIGCFILASALISFFANPQLTNLSSFIVPVCYVSVLPIYTYFSSKKLYNSNNRISERITYTINPDNYLMKGESFSAELSWSKIYKVTKTKDWILIWQNKQTANVIPLKNITGSQIQEFKTVLHNNSVKNNL